MKKILQSAVLFFGVCFFAGKANAQLASDTPAMTTEQAAKLMKERMATIPVRAADSVTISKTTTKTIAVKKRPAIIRPGCSKSGTCIRNNKAGSYN